MTCGVRRALGGMLLAGGLCWLYAAAQAGTQVLIITSGADFLPGLPPTGSIGSAFCTGLKIQGLVSAQGFPLPITLADSTGTPFSGPGRPIPLSVPAGQQAATVRLSVTGVK